MVIRADAEICNYLGVARVIHHLLRAVTMAIKLQSPCYNVSSSGAAKTHIHPTEVFISSYNTMHKGL